MERSGIRGEAPPSLFSTPTRITACGFHPGYKTTLLDATKEKACDVNRRPFLKLARPEGFEPPTPWFVAKYSIQMSYGRVERREL